MQQYEIIVHSHDELLCVPSSPNLTLAQNLFAAGFYEGIPLCSGLGHCGLCRVCYRSDPPVPTLTDGLVISETLLAKGWRLGCCRYPEGRIEISLPSFSTTSVPLTASDLPAFKLLAIDIGTTAIKWKGIRYGSNEVICGQHLNPQLGAGGDVMGRMAFALQSSKAQKRLQEVLFSWLRSLLLSRLDVHALPDLVITGNSVMVYLLLGKSLDSLATAPYSLEYTGGETCVLDSSLPPAYIPPLLSPFIGADISCGIMHLLQAKDDTLSYPFALADLGTNGEFVLVTAPDTFLVTSVAMGPALEGVGLSQGTLAAPGVCTGFTLTPAGLSSVAGSPDHGISGSGYISLVALLCRLGVLGEEGGFQEPTTLLGKKVWALVREIDGRTSLWFHTTEILTGEDVEEILKVKASCNCAFEALAEEAGITLGQITSLYIAGSLGDHCAAEDLVEVGLVPGMLQEKVVPIGNSSLAGAWELVQIPNLREQIRVLRQGITTVSLAEEKDFSTKFVEKMRFTYC